MWFAPLALRAYLMTVLAVLFLPVFASSLSAETLDQSAMLSITCAGCHGTDGHSTGAIPSIAGMPAAYIEKAMLDFRDDKRASTVMGRHAKGYSDAEIKMIAAFYSQKQVK